MLQDTLNPVWHRKLVLEYHFEERQLIQFKVFDRDSASEDLQVRNFKETVSRDKALKKLRYRTLPG
jgi:hypothetical protein